jgi:hypothetical protein
MPSDVGLWYVGRVAKSGGNKMGQSLLLVAKDFIASNFATIVAGGFGAFFGAVGAQFIISRGQNRQAVVGELNNVNAALSLCYAICNTFIALKQQHITALSARFLAERATYLRVLQERQQAPAAGPVREHVVQFDLQTTSPVQPPMENLERLIFDKVSIRGRGLAAAVELAAAIDYLNKSVLYRNALIDEFRKEQLSQQQKIDRYFGLPTQGVADQRFSTNVEAISKQTDDCIFFSRALADDLLTYGRQLRRRYRWKYLNPLPGIEGADWSRAEAAGLLPSRKDYKAWLRRFKEPQPRGFHKLLQWVSGWLRRKKP